jgi:molybdopterin synthase catalytic subunit
MKISVQREDFDLSSEVKALSKDRGIGALASFVGVVREIGMTLEHYPGMTEKALEEIEAEACRRWPLEATLIVHRHGRLEAGERIVLVAVGSPHREAAFEACEFLVDWLKTKAPFWKLEETPAGEKWVGAHEGDDAAAQRWEKKR